MMNMNRRADIKMPMVGFGTYLISDADARLAVYQAIRAGYRHIDTAEAYGNEKGVGLGLQAAMKELDLSRDDVFVTTKLWPGNEAWGQPLKTYSSTIESLNTSLADLQLDYVDLYLIHAPLAKKQRLEQWRALTELRQLGKARAIGVSNFSQVHIEEIKAAGLPLPDANQIELHPWSQKPELVSKTEDMKNEADQADAPFKKMAQKYGVSEAQVLLRWGLQKGYAVLPKSTKEERMRQNIDLFSFEIDDEDMEALAQMDKGEGVAWSVGDPTKVA
jgi:2,5-diketo-D-gluconate reductase A